VDKLIILKQVYGYMAEYQGDYNDLVYLRARMYAPEMGRFITRDTWKGNDNRPLSFNRWIYTEGNPVNLIDPTGNDPITFEGLEQCFQLAYDATSLAIDNNTKTVPDFRGMCIVNYVMAPNSSDYVNTYVAAGVAIESNYYSPWVDTRGGLYFKYLNPFINFLFRRNNTAGLGICNISDEQMEGIYGKPINGSRKNFGLGLSGLDQEDPDVAILGMRNRITQVLEDCNSCSSTDEFLVAALAEGINFNKDSLAELKDLFKQDAAGPIEIRFRWLDYLKSHPTSYDHNLRQIRLFQVDILELRKMSKDWFVPGDLVWQYILNLGNGIGDETYHGTQGR
jgi:RHS repeat-associated protein